MFASRNRIVYDFERPENLYKWQGIFVNPLRTIMEKVRPTMRPKDEALEYVEILILRLLGSLCARPSPRSAQDVAKRVRRTFPSPIDRGAITDAQEALNRWPRMSTLTFPVDGIHNLLQREVFKYQLDPKVSFYMMAVLEYLCSEIFKLTGNYVKHFRRLEITEEDIRDAMCADKVLMDMFHPDTDAGPSTAESPIGCLRHPMSFPLQEAIKDLTNDEKQYVRDIQVIVKVFREELAKLVKNPKDVDDVFSNISDIYGLSLTLLESLEETVRGPGRKEFLQVGYFFEELAEAKEFEAYRKYTKDITSNKQQEALNKLLSLREVYDGLHSTGQGFYEAVKYYLPKLLQVPIWHFFVYLEYIEKIYRLADHLWDKESLGEAARLLRPLKMELKALIEKSNRRDMNPPVRNEMRKQITIEKMNELRGRIDGWERQDLGQGCKEFIREDILCKIKDRRRQSERHAFLFDNFLFLCKPNSERRLFSFKSQRTNYDLRLKEKFRIQKVDIVDKEDTEDLKNAFEIRQKHHRKVVLVAKSAEEKNGWMADLIRLKMKNTLDVKLNALLLREDAEGIGISGLDT